jgi:hypothetical protein
LALTWQFSCHWVILLCPILSSYYDLIIHNSFRIGSLQLCLWQAQKPFKGLPQTYMWPSTDMESASNLITTEEMSEWKYLLKTIFWFTLDWTKVDTNTAFLTYLKENKELMFKAFCPEITWSNTTQGRVLERIRIFIEFLASWNMP